MRLCVAIVAAAALAACGRTATTTAPAAVASANGKVGYVQMDELVRKHPLYDQLARYDRSIEAFDLTATAPRALSADPHLREEAKQLEQQLHDAADRTQKLLDQKQRQYQLQESQAIEAALRGAGSGPTAAQIAGRLNATARQQEGGAGLQAQRDYQAFQAQVRKQDEEQVVAAQKALAERADRTFRAKSDELQSKESALSLELANEDAAQRLALRTKLSSLALDDAAREDAQKQLAALDRKEADAVGAQRNRDQQTLLALSAQLKAQVEKDLRTQVDQIHKRSIALLSQRQSALAGPASGIAGPIVQTTVVNGKPRAVVNPSLPPALRTQIQKLHDDYQKRFQNDAKTTIAEFTKTREELSRRYAQLQGVDVSAQSGANTQIEALRKKRSDLYDQITAQIDREVRLIAQQRGVSVVLTDVVAPADGVDLTPDALKDIESLHE
ncbi:MAG TPA: OmpH family outer membrane protein [Candidatus Limnocylindria bacterium]|jgi:hypothetical protein|nr:OmpH family outer membrane protein [Candidatus Limnocylindria bacterium]